MSGPFAQLLRYTAPADALSTTVRLRSAGTASLAFEQNYALKMGSLRAGGKRKKMGMLMEWIYWIDILSGRFLPMISKKVGFGSGESSFWKGKK